MKRFLTVIICVGLIFSSFILSTPIYGYYTNMPASVVVGQTDFASSATGITASNFGNGNGPYTAVAEGNNFIVVDRINKRVLLYNKIPSSNGASADVVLGQPDFTTATTNYGGLSASSIAEPVSAMLKNNKLFVSDRGNARIVIFNSLPTTNNMTADVVVLKTSFTDTTNTTTQTTGNQGFGQVTTDGQRLIISTASENRVLIWNTIPTSNGAPADVVLGQQSFTTKAANDSNGDGVTDTVAANTLNNPLGVYFDGTHLFVTDFSNNRTLIWNSMPTQNGQPADVVIGQPDFTHNSSNQGVSVGPNTLSNPGGVYSNGTRLFIVDNGNRRILIYNKIPSSNGTPADVALGQPDLTTNAAPSSVAANSIFGPQSVFISDNKLFAADQSIRRVLIFNNVISTPTLSISSLVDLGSGKFRISGNVVLGERPYYSLQNLKVNVNGQGEGNIVNKDGGNDNGPGSTMYEFWHDIEPWGGSNGEQKDWVANPSGMLKSLGFTASFRASSYNADENKVFYFTPFSLDKVKQTSTTDSFPSFSFTVNKNQRSEMKSNLKYYQVSVKKTGDIDFTKYIDNIPVDFDAVKLDPTNIQNYRYASSLANTDGTYETKDILVNYSNTSSNLTVKSKTNPLSPGTYSIQVRAINIMNHEQQSNNLNLTISKRQIPQASFATQTSTISPVSSTTQPVQTTTLNPGPTPTPFPTPTPKPKTCFLFWCW